MLKPDLHDEATNFANRIMMWTLHEPIFKSTHGLDHPRMKNVIVAAYLDLLKAIAENDRETIAKLTEAKLAKAFCDGLDDL